MKRPTITFGRTITTALALSLVVLGVAYAALLSNFAVVGGSTITTASAALRVSSDGQHFSDRVEGFEFANIMPGLNLQPIEGKAIALRNEGTSRLELHLNVDPVQAAGLDVNRVYLAFTRSDTGSVQQYPLSALTSGQLTRLDVILNPGQRIDYKIQVRIDEGALTDVTQPAVVSGLNMVFDGSTENT